MELELLKEIWKKTGEGDNVHRDKQLLNMIITPSRNIVAVIRRNLLIELIVVLVSVTIIAVCYFISFNGKLQEVSWVYIVLAAVFVWYYLKKNRLLKEMQCTRCNVKSNLELQVKMLEKYVRLYLFIGTAMVPVVLLFFYALFYYKHIIMFPSTSVGRSEVTFALLYLFFTAIFTIVLYFFHRWYINRLYGRYIQKLKSLLYEMEELE